MVTKPSGDIQRLAGRRNSHYAGFGHLDYLTGDYNAVANVVNFTAEVADLVWDAEAAVTAAVQTAQEIAGGAYGIGSQPMELPRNTELGAMAFVGRTERLHLYPMDVGGGSDTITPDDMGKLVISDAGTVTLPAGTAPGMGVGWIVAIKNKHSSSGATLAADGSDTIDGGASISIAAGDWAIIVQTDDDAFVSLAS